MSRLSEVLGLFEQWAKSFGAVDAGDNCCLRRNIAERAFQDGGAYFAYVRPEEEASGPYTPIAGVFGRQDGKGGRLCVGLWDQKDYELALSPASADGIKLIPMMAFKDRFLILKPTYRRALRRESLI